MNNIQQFLEEEYKNPQTQSLKEHDNRLINFILSEVEREVEKELGTEFDRASEKVSTIINNLRLK